MHLLLPIESHPASSELRLLLPGTIGARAPSSKRAVLQALLWLQSSGKGNNFSRFLVLSMELELACKRSRGFWFSFSGGAEMSNCVKAHIQHARVELNPKSVLKICAFGLHST